VELLISFSLELVLDLFGVELENFVGITLFDFVNNELNAFLNPDALLSPKVLVLFFLLRIVKFEDIVIYYLYYLFRIALNFMYDIKIRKTRRKLQVIIYETYL